MTPWSQLLTVVAHYVEDIACNLPEHARVCRSKELKREKAHLYSLIRVVDFTSLSDLAHDLYMRSFSKSLINLERDRYQVECENTRCINSPQQPCHAHLGQLDWTLTYELTFLIVRSGQ